MNLKKVLGEFTMNAIYITCLAFIAKEDQFFFVLAFVAVIRAVEYIYIRMVWK